METIISNDFLLPAQNIQYSLLNASVFSYLASLTIFIQNRLTPEQLRTQYARMLLQAQSMHLYTKEHARSNKF